MNFLVTGGGGFIGSHVCEKLISAQHKVVCLDNFDEFYPKQVKQNNLKELKENARFSLVVGDIRDTDDLIDLLENKKIETVVHLAAKAGVTASMQNPAEYVSVNTQGTVSVLEAMKEASVKKLVLASSSSVYGNRSKVPFSEDQVLEAPISAYAASKQAAEIFARMYHEVYGLNIIALRFFTVYGPRQRPDLAIHKFMKAVLKGDTIQINGNGSMQRDYTYIEDICNGILSSINRLNEMKSPVYEVYNIGNSSPVNLNDLIAAIEEVSGKKAIKKFRDIPLGDVPVTFADVSKAGNLLGYHPSTDLKSGLTQFMDWLNTRV